MAQRDYLKHLILHLQPPLIKLNPWRGRRVLGFRKNFSTGAERKMLETLGEEIRAKK